MPKSVGLEALMTKRNELVSEKNKMNEELDKQIQEMESCIELLSGKTVWEIEAATVYDDENPNYIKSSLEEI